VQYEHDLKLWWPHNEAMYVCLLVHYLTDKPEYETWFERIHARAFEHFPDKQCGDWFKYLHRDGAISVPLKGNAWAGPFHLSRMQLYVWQLLEQMTNPSRPCSHI